MKRILSFVLALLLAASLTACGSETALQDGYYTAQAAEFSHGWKEYITILVKDGSIISVEYNAENASGFIKSWDNAYMQNMLHSNGTYPNEYTRNYAGQLLRGPGHRGGQCHHRRHLLPRLLPKAVRRRAGPGPQGGFQRGVCGYQPLNNQPLPIYPSTHKSGSSSLPLFYHFIALCLHPFLTANAARGPVFRLAAGGTTRW